MEYEFVQINRHGAIEVKHVFDNEAFKHWLNVEIAGCLDTTYTWKASIFEVLTQIKKNLNSAIPFYKQWVGKEFTLSIENDIVKVCANFLFQSLSDEDKLSLKEENLSLDESEFEGVAAIEDFYELLEDYHDFILSVMPDNSVSD